MARLYADAGQRHAERARAAMTPAQRAAADEAQREYVRLYGCRECTTVGAKEERDGK